MNRPPFPFAGEAAALVSGLLWACAGIVFRRMRGRVDAAAVNLAKNTTGAVGMTVVVWLLTGAFWPTAVPLEAQAWLVASGVVGLSICDTYFLRAIMEIGPRRATLLMLLAPVLVLGAVALPPFRQVEALTRPASIVGAALALAGVALASREAPDLTVGAERARRGTIDGLLAALFQAVGVLLARMGIERGSGPVEGAQVRLVAGAAGLAVGGVLWRAWPRWSGSLSSPRTLRTLVIAAFFGTFLGIGLNQCALAWSASTGIATTLNALSPVWLIPLSTVFLAERHGARAWISTIIAIAGVALMTL
jgi:drug/metabolite transporter (DMT)-like permease